MVASGGNISTAINVESLRIEYRQVVTVQKGHDPLNIYRD